MEIVDRLEGVPRTDTRQPGMPRCRFVIASVAVTDNDRADVLTIKYVVETHERTEVQAIEFPINKTINVEERKASPFSNVEVVQFCSSLLAWQLLEEEAAQVALCPLSITLYQVAGEAEEMFLTYRSPGQSTAGRMKAEKLLQRLVDRSIELARLRW